MEWHDAKTDLEAPSGPLWVPLEGIGGPDRIEMGTYGISGGWQSAFNRDVTFNPEKVLAWAVVEFPEVPVKCWVEPPPPNPGRRGI